MSKLNLAESEASIIAEIQTLDRDVYEIEMPEDKALKYDKFGALAEPFYVVTFSGPLPAPAGDRSLMGAADDPVQGVVAIQTCAGDTNSLRDAHTDVLDLLTGFYPVGSGEMRWGGGNSYSLASNVVRPTLYVRVSFYTYETNIIFGED